MQIKKVIDYGDYYLIVLPKYLPILDVICQKSLLVKGSLEEFETLFQNKIEIAKTVNNQGTVL